MILVKIFGEASLTTTPPPFDILGISTLSVLRTSDQSCQYAAIIHSLQMDFIVIGIYCKTEYMYTSI